MGSLGPPRGFCHPDYPPTADNFARHVARKWGDRNLAIIGDRRLTYRAAEAESARMAQGLLAAGLGRGSRVALLAPNGPEWIIGWLAAARVGALVVLLNTFYQARELGWALAHCEAEALLTVDRYLGRDYGRLLEEAVDGLAGQTHGDIKVADHPNLRTVWMWVSEGSELPAWAGAADDLLAEANEVVNTGLRADADGVANAGLRADLDEVADNDLLCKVDEVADADLVDNVDFRTEVDEVADSSLVVDTDLQVAADEVDNIDLRTDIGLISAAKAVSPDDSMVVIYTSGSTADPKGVIHSHSAVIVHPFNLLPFRDLTPDAVIFTPMPLFWVGGLSYALVSAMHAGATVVFQERFEPGAALDLIETHRVTHVTGWPHTSKALLEHPSFASRDLSSLRSASLDELLPKSLRARDPSRRSIALGMTESLGPHTIEPAGVELPEGKEGSNGRSVPGMSHRIVDPNTGAELPAGKSGEIWIRGYSLMLGLIGMDSSEVFEPGGWYRTGDRGHLDADGHLYFQGRLGSLVKTAGMSVSPAEVESHIEQQPGVSHAFVVGVPDIDRGQAVVAAVVAKPAAGISPDDFSDDLRARLRLELASYKVPRHVAVFADPKELPWLESGKINYRVLRQLLTDRYGI